MVSKQSAGFRGSPDQGAIGHGGLANRRRNAAEGERAFVVVLWRPAGRTVGSQPRRLLKPLFEARLGLARRRLFREPASRLPPPGPDQTTAHLMPQCDSATVAPGCWLSATFQDAGQRQKSMRVADSGLPRPEAARSPFCLAAARVPIAPHAAFLRFPSNTPSSRAVPA